MTSADQVREAAPLTTGVLRQPDVMANPYPFYHRLRTEDPVHWEENQFVQMWVLTRYADVMAMHRDPRLSAARPWGTEPMIGWLPAEARPTAAQAQQAYGQQVLFRDPPDHTRLRRLLMAAFTPRVVEGMRPRIQQMVDEMLDSVEGAGEMELIGDLAYPLPARVIADLLGVPKGDLEMFRAWSADMAATLDGDPRRPELGAAAYRGVAALLEYMAGLVDQRQRAPQDDLMQALITASVEGEVLSPAEVVANCVLLLFAGHETTTNLIGNGLLTLLRHPDQLLRLRENPDLIAGTVEELLRYESPVQVTGRYAMEDLEIGGKGIRAGQSVVMYLGAANRDPAQFEDPDRLDLGRPNNHHLAFAQGSHFCLGAALARIEGQMAIGTVVQRFPHLSLKPEAVNWRPNFALRGLQALHVSL